MITIEFDLTLDTLMNCFVTFKTRHGTIWLREDPHKLLNLDSMVKMNEVLNDCHKQDHVTRVRSRIQKIQGNWGNIVKQNE